MTIMFPHPPGSGGPGGFQRRFEQELKNKGWTIKYASDAVRPDVVFVVGGTRRLFWLLKMKLKGIPIIYRLDGINWLHRKRKDGLKQLLMGEIHNFLNKIIHAFLANHIVYQSQFVKKWWEKEGWRKRRKWTIIHNGVNLKEFCPASLLEKTVPLVCLEGMIDYSPYVIQLLNQFRELLPDFIQIELYGGFANKKLATELSNKIHYHGAVTRDKVSEVLRNSVYLSLDVNPACPNTVVEALASGSPVVAFDTGALPELVVGDAGIVVPYGSDPWQLEFPDVKALSRAILKVMGNYTDYSKKARKIAEERYSIDTMTEKYYDIINRLRIKKE